MPDYFGNFLSEVMSIKNRLFRGEDEGECLEPSDVETVSHAVEEHLRTNFVEFAGEFVKSSGNIDFSEFGDCKFKKAAFSKKLDPKIDEALKFLIDHVFK